MTLADLPADLPSIVQRLWLNFMVFDTARYLIAACVMAAIVAVLRWTGSPRRIQARSPRAADYRRELLTSLRTAAVFAAVGLLTVWAKRNGWIAHVETPAAAGTVALYLVGLLLWHDTWFYWTHRAMHDRRIFPWMHRTHHRSTTPTPFAAYAFSTSEAVVQTAFFPLWLAVVPTPIDATFIFLTVMIVRNVMGHAGHELHPRGWADHPVLQWINTTVHHDLHHSGGFRTNYGLYFTWWDRICGTEHPEYRARFRALTAARSGVDQPLPAGVGQE